MTYQELMNKFAPHFFSFLRINGILTLIPFFGDQPIPLKARTALSFFLVLVMWDLVEKRPVIIPVETYQTVLLAVKELVIGMVLGFAAKVAFEAIIMASTIVATQMGFGADKVFLPDYSGELDSFTALHRTLIMLIFLSLNLHYMFIVAIQKSFEIVPILGADISGATIVLLTDMCVEMYIVALQLAAPILVSMLFATTALGILSRSVPQLNTFVVSYPINFFIGIMVYIATLTSFPDWTAVYFDTLGPKFSRLLFSLKTGE